MNKKLIALVITLFVATSAQSYQFNETNIGTVNEAAHPTVFIPSEMLKLHIKGMKDSNYATECKVQARFERNIQTAVLAGSGVVVATFLGCIFAEWLQEFKLRKAEKAKLIAKLNHETRQIETACYTA